MFSILNARTVVHTTTSNGFFSRYVVYINYEKKNINVQRYKCKVCGGTFSNLPEDVLPRKKRVFSLVVERKTILIV